MASKKNYKLRVEEFIVKGYDLSTIQKLIFREYAIRLKKSSIKKFFLKKVEKENTHSIDEFDEKKSSLDYLNKISELKNVKKLFFENFTKDFTTIDKYDSKIRNLIRIVLRDNIVTNSERTFFIEKLKEYNLNDKFLDEISNYTFSKNPYYDEIFEMIWSDNIVNKNEINFIYEKSIENSQQKEPLNKRFWIYSIKNKYEELLKLDNFRKIVKLNAINSIMTLDYAEDKVFNYLDIFKKIDNLEIIIENAKETFEEWTNENFNNLQLDIPLEFFYQRIDLDFEKQFQTEKLILKDKKVLNELEVKGYYSKKDLYSFFNVSVMQHGGKWNNGYCEHENKWFIFCNINIEGKGYYDQNFDYSNSFDPNGNLNWEARYGSKIHWESIEKISNSKPYIFTKEKEGDIKWKYYGRGECLNIEDTTPVKILWRILSEKIIANEPYSENPEILINDPYEEVINLSKTNMFLAFEKYKKIALKNNSKMNPRRIRSQFNDLIEEVS